MRAILGNVFAGVAIAAGLMLVTPGAELFSLQWWVASFIISFGTTIGDGIARS